MRALLVRLGAIGDVVNALVVATALKERDASTRVGWAVHDLARPLVEGHPSVDRVHLWPRAAGAWGFRALVREVRAAGYDLAVDLQRLQKSALLARLSGAARVVGFDRARTKELSWLWTRERVDPGDPGAHVVQQYADVARHLGCEGPPRRLLPEDPAAEAWAGRAVRELGAAPVAIVLGASKPPNRWAPARFGELAARLAEDAPVVLVGGAEDRPAADAARAAAGGAPLLDLVGDVDLRQVAALARRARLAVACDTGPMHLAAAAGAPVVALFGPADPRRTGPWGEGHAVVRSPTGDMADLSLEPVLEACRARLGVAERMPR